MTRPHVLIAGASIAGPALAFWLARYGWDTTIVERAPAFRTGGQNIDIRGAAREVIRRAGLEDTVRNATTGEVGTRFIGERRQHRGRIPGRRSPTRSAPTAEVEILRGDLARILVDAGEGQTEYRYGDRITALDDNGSEVVVSFEQRRRHGLRSGGRRRRDRFFHQGSRLRRRRHGPPHRDGDDVPHHPPRGHRHGLVALVQRARRPRRHASTRPARHHPGDPVIDHLLHSDLGMPARHGLPTSRKRIYANSSGTSVGRLRASSMPWTVRTTCISNPSVRCTHPAGPRVASHWWATPPGARRRSVAWAPVWPSSGAYVLAGELASHVDHRDAFAGYDRIMRPYVDQAQKLPPGVPRIANPRTRVGLAVLRVALRFASSRLAKKLGDQLFSPPADKIDLPDYTHLEKRATDLV